MHILAAATTNSGSVPHWHNETTVKASGYYNDLSAGWSLP